jgi:hypothetical protein
VTTDPASRPAFAHASEAELARILDFYQVRWTYEPDTFPIAWTMTGEVAESFSPDFYLPDLDLYIELTTLKQKLVRKKNRKLRRLRELYPDVRIKLFYARDFRMLLLKFGRLALADDLSGTIGQATPPRSADRIVVEAGAAAGLLVGGDRPAIGHPAADSDRVVARAPRGHHVGTGIPGSPAALAGDPGPGPVRLPGADEDRGLDHPAQTPRGRRRGRRRRHEARPAPGATSIGTGTDSSPG